jgi:hypothetical protein
MRNRLKDLIIQSTQKCDSTDCNTCKYWNTNDCGAVRIADHLIANGVILPPCKVGDKVYYINTRPHIVLRQNEIYEAKVVRIIALSLGVSLVIHTRGEYGCCETPDIRDWNETVFLTKAQAEQKLKELRENG